MRSNKKFRGLAYFAAPLILFSLPHLTHAIETGAKIVRDEYGVPHIYAKSDYSLWYATGYAQAQDRLWQADIMRRSASGRMAEFLGATYVSSDVFARNFFGSDSERTRMISASSALTQLQFKAFADGMNAWIQQAIAAGTLPIEYRAQGLVPEAWRMEDSVAVLQLIFGQFGEAGADELTNAAVFASLAQRLGPAAAAAVFSDTHWINDPNAITTIPASSTANGLARINSTARSTGGAETSKEISDEWEKQEKEWKHHLEKLGIKGKSSSNAIAIGPKLSADGRALLLGGPQMGYSTPQVAVEMGLHHDDLHVTGATFAGIPGIAIGATRHFAWSFTSGMSDTSDFYLDPPVNLTCRDEVIKVRGATDIAQSFCRNAHGAVFGKYGDYVITLKRAAEGLEVVSYEALQKMALAKTIAQADLAMSNWAPNFNMIMADTAGNIAYWHLGRIPVRASGDNPWLPHVGNGQFEWQGFVPWRDMPKVANPEQGWLANWNNKPRADWNNSVPELGSWGPTHRIKTLTDLLGVQKPGTMTLDKLAEINRIAGHTTQTPSDASANVFVPALLVDMLAQLDTSQRPDLQSAKDLLLAWNGLQVDADNNGRYDHPGVAIFNTWFGQFTNNVFGDDLGALYSRNLTANLTWRLLHPDIALPLQYDYLGGQSVQQALLAAFDQTVTALTTQYASADAATWLQASAVINWKQIGAAAAPNTPWMNRGTYNQLIHLGPGKEMFGQNVVAPGQSGDPYNPHFADQLALYATWRYKPMRLTRYDLIDHTESVTDLTPPQ